MNTALVTGGGGYLGGKLCEHLLRNEYTVVVAFDLHHSNEETVPGLERVTGDIRDDKMVLHVMRKFSPDVVFHLASYGMSGKEMLEKEKIEHVNVNGTQNVINACVLANVNCLIYTSTYNVVFGGQEIRNGNESLPYFPLEKHVDHYSRTKAIAEQIVLKANGSSLEDRKEKLFTCSLRCAGIYGEGERRHLPRIVSYIEKGLFCFTYGSNDSLVDFLHCDNFALAHHLAAKQLTCNPTVVAGKPYFISDGNPINNFVFFKPLIEGLGYSYPILRLPFSLVYFIAFFIEVLHRVVGRCYNFQPLLTRAEVFKTGVTHYFSIDAAQKDFGYQPMTRNMKNIIKWFKEHGHGRNKRSSIHSSSAWMIVIIVCVLWLFIFSLLPTVG